MKTIRIAALTIFMCGIAQATIEDRIEHKIDQINSELKEPLNTGSTIVRHRRSSKKQASTKKTCTTQTKESKK